ncbi:MAG TPA: tol-pal system protein YbgF [Burkholderiaceae bacterium]|nr:tol-pal system protein YbgF [Burkholderiaceae bacterium]
MLPIQRLRLLRAAACAALLAGAAAAHAGIFDDDEARRAILDLRTRITALEDARRTHDAQVDQTIKQLQDSLLDMSNQNEQLRSQLAQMRGDSEQLARNVADVQRTQKDLQQGVNDRLKAVEPQKVDLDGKSFTADPDEVRAYEDAMSTLRGGDFDHATQSFKTFLQRYPSSGYDDSVRYWMGNAQFGTKDYKGAVVTFRNFVSSAPDHPRAPEALLAIANCQIELKDTRTARRTLDDLMRQYPKSEAAGAARDRLATLK